MIDLLVSPRFADVAGWFLGFIWPLGGLFALWYWHRRPSPHARVIQTVLLFLTVLGPFIVGMWFVFNAVVGWLGLDSVAALLVNLAIFIVAGVALGFVVQRAVNTFKT
ncbi:hypothetical protein JW916_08795 [Candidatus Sumerlaeota bacterium]|nr:hypothetical protein [Candidatus Sumerlaeota bacterium]